MPRHKGNILYRWVLLNTEVWVDIDGNEHVIAEMPKDYALNALLFLYEQHYDTLTVLGGPRRVPVVTALRERILDDHTPLTE